MKNKFEKFNQFLMIFFLFVVLAGIVSRLFLDSETWLSLITIIAVSSALYALSDLYKKSADNTKNLSILSAGIIDPLYTRFDSLGYFTDNSGTHMSKASYSSDYDFNQYLRNITDGRERALRELVWEKKVNDKSRKGSRSDSAVHSIFLVLALVILVGGCVTLFFLPQYFPRLETSLMEIICLCSFAFTLAVAFANGSNLGSMRRVQMLLNLKERCAVVEPAAVPTPPAPAPVVVVAPAHSAVTTGTTTQNPISIQDAVAPVPPVASDVAEEEDDLSSGTEWKPLDEKDSDD